MQAAPRAKIEDIALTAMLAVQCLALFVTAPLAALGYDVPRYLTRLLLLAFVLLVMLVSHGRLLTIIVIVAIGGDLSSAILNLVSPSSLTDLLSDFGSMMGFIVLGYVIARAIFGPGRVNIHRVLGAIVLYMTIVLCFSTGYRLILDLISNAFNSVPGNPDPAKEYASLVYFSFVTLTSTGFGDIVPIHPLARSMVNLEAVIGQLYPATLLARLVTLHVEGQRR
jgi:hypothetical protein